MPALLATCARPSVVGPTLKKPLDRALIEITASQEWRGIEESYFGG
jgi:hypothetical protein